MGMSRHRSYLVVGTALLGCQSLAEAFAPRLVGNGEPTSLCPGRGQTNSGLGEPFRPCIGGSVAWVGGSISNVIGSQLYVGSSIDPSQDGEVSPLEIDGTDGGENADLLPREDDSDRDLPLSALWSMLTGTGGGPPLQVDDNNLLLYDVFLLVNLSASISFWVVHRLNFLFIAESLNEGALLCICWIVAGLANGAFLHSAVDGHWDPSGKDADKGGPKAAGLLGLSTFIGTSSIRIIIALAVAVAEHRPVGGGGEALIPLEILVGLILMSSWRALHSAYTPRL
jgi:hypothetical protein